MVKLAFDASTTDRLRRDWVDAVRSGGAVKRCHVVQTIGEPTVAAHSWGVVVLIHRLDPFASKELIMAGVFHDVAEKWTGDVPADVKWRQPAIKALLDKVEDDVKNDLSINFEASLTDAERFTLTVADRLDLMWYCVDQRRLGNAHVDVVFSNVLSWFDSVDYKLGFAARALLNDVHDVYDKLTGNTYLVTETAQRA